MLELTLFSTICSMAVSRGAIPGTNFQSQWYLDSYSDVREVGINPLVHYLKFGSKEGRKAQRPRSDSTDLIYTCPVCASKLKSFSPINPYYEKNKKKYGNPFTFDDAETINPDQYQCPLCGASDRDRLYALYLMKALSMNLPPKTISLLDIAPSQPLKMFLLKYPCVNYLSADKYMQNVDLVLDVTDMNTIQSDSYNIFICSHVLEHVVDDKKALLELYRILKPGGWGIIMAPINLKINHIDEDPFVTDVGERWRRFGQDDHIRLYSKKGFIGRVENAGFTLKQYGTDFFGEGVFRQNGVSAKSVLYIAEKN